MNIKRSRHIPSKIKNKVDKRHFFECAWCGTHITERHHINAFSEGGNHSEKNLILLCSNCHSQTHNGKIHGVELSNRISTHLKGDRISGGIQFELPESIVRLGDCTFINCKNLIVLNGNPIIEISKKEDGLFYLSLRFYDRNGDLIFWMADNRYWCDSDFTIESKKGILVIKRNNEEKILKIAQDINSIILEGKCWINGMLMTFSTENGIILKNGTEKNNIPISTIKNFVCKDCLNGFGFDS